MATVSTELATRVANKLASGKDMTKMHRDYCGIGLNFDRGTYVMGECYDGYPCGASQSSESWRSTDEFVTWLAAQSDHALGNPGNQRITLERLTAFVSGSTEDGAGNAYKADGKKKDKKQGKKKGRVVLGCELGFT